MSFLPFEYENLAVFPSPLKILVSFLLAFNNPAPGIVHTTMPGAGLFSNEIAETGYPTLAGLPNFAVISAKYGLHLSI